MRQQTVAYEPKSLMLQLSQLICGMISLMPAQHSIHLITETNEKNLVVRIENTGINLTRFSEMITGLPYSTEVAGTLDGSCFSFAIALEQHQHPTMDTLRFSPSFSPAWRGFYAMIRNRLRSHFSKGENLVALLSRQDPKDAAFLQKINALILANMEDEQFDTNGLCKRMCLSRTQLFRKLKPMIRQAPGHYIRQMRLEKAKELLETSDLNIGEVTFRTGFQSQSHFTKAFSRHYGVAPSLFRRRGTK